MKYEDRNQVIHEVCSLEGDARMRFVAIGIYYGKIKLKPFYVQWIFNLLRKVGNLSNTYNVIVKSELRGSNISKIVTQAVYERMFDETEDMFFLSVKQDLDAARFPIT